MGSVSSPSTIALTLLDAFTTFLAANIPRKNEMNVATIPVFREMKSGLQSSFSSMAIISCIRSSLRRISLLSLMPGVPALQRAFSA